jgi:hypothetical protein
MSHSAAAPMETAAPSAAPKMLIIAFVAIIIVAETAIFFMFVPSADDVAALAEAKLIQKVEANMEHDGEHTLQDEDKAVEFSFGEYGVIFTPPGSDRNYRVEFRLFGTVRKKDETRLRELYAEREKRFRHRMILEVRNATKDELAENQLGLIQRRILATSNEILEEPLLLGVGFEDYQVIEE